MRPTRWSIPFLSLALLAAACSGGGGGSPSASTYAISGKITGATGVSVALSGAASTSTTTDANGDYSFASLSNGEYTVTPSKGGYTFTPASLAVTVNGADVSGRDFSATAIAVTRTLSGTVSGPWVEAVTVTLGGAGSGTTQTDATGHYSFTGLVNGGSYTVTPSLEGYGYTPPSATVAMTSDKVQDFSASPSVQSYSVSGTIGYSGSHSGRIYLFAYSNTCSSCSALAGTSIPAGTWTYTIRGLPGNDSYAINAAMDPIGHVRPNANDPEANSTNVTITNADVTGANLTLVDPPPPAPAVPGNIRVFPGNGFVVLTWDGATDLGSGQEASTSYQISWGTDAAATNGGTKTVDAAGMGAWIHSGLSNGTAMYYKIRAAVWSSWSAWSTPVSVTVGSVAGDYTVSGQVSFSGAATGPLYVVANDDTNKVIRVSRYANPTSPVTYSITGVAAGSQQLIAIMDRDNDGIIDEGDWLGDGGLIAVSGNMTGQNIALITANADPGTWVQHTSPAAGSEFYSIEHKIRDGAKRPTSVTLFSGRSAVPLDVPANDSGDALSVWRFLGASRPFVGDAYRFKVLYSDGTSEILATSVTAVLDCFPQGLTVNSSSPYSAGVPQFSWTAPASPPASYGYQVSVQGPVYWWYPDGGLLPSTTTSVVFDEDGRASNSSLGAGTYTWSVSCGDANGNTATTQAPYVVP